MIAFGRLIYFSGSIHSTFANVIHMYRTSETVSGNEMKMQTTRTFLFQLAIARRKRKAMKLFFILQPIVNFVLHLLLSVVLVGSTASYTSHDINNVLYFIVLCYLSRGTKFANILLRYCLQRYFINIFTRADQRTSSTREYH